MVFERKGGNTLYGRIMMKKRERKEKYPCGDGKKITFRDLNQQVKNRGYGPS
jgi:hypothetical protein